MVRSFGLRLSLPGVASAVRYDSASVNTVFSADVTAQLALEQFTPEKANWTTFYSKVQNNNHVSNHTPDGTDWITDASWKEWDGTVFNPEEYSRQAFYELICPTADTVRGIRTLFYEHNPFANVTHPTKAEVDEWHRLALNHVRAMVGYTNEIQPDKCLHQRALWSHQRYWSRMWDHDYPHGTCEVNPGDHCGADFIPSHTDQEPYLFNDTESCEGKAGSEGIFNGAKADIPWSIKWSRAFCATLKQEGFWGGHVGPWFHRAEFGWSWWDMDPDESDSNAELRAKWGGESAESLYHIRANGSAPQYPGQECQDVKWYDPDDNHNVTNAEDCYTKIQQDVNCSKRFMTFNDINAGCGCYTAEVVSCIPSSKPGRLTWDFEPEPSWDNASVGNAILPPNKRCSGDMLWQEEADTNEKCLEVIKQIPECGKKFLTRNRGRGCACYPKTLMTCSQKHAWGRQTFNITFSV